MPWVRLDDVGYDDPLVRAVGNAAYGAVTRMKQYSSAQRVDGWLPASKAREIASRAELRSLTSVRVGELGPFLHRPGDECRCLAGRSFPDGVDGYVVHDFLMGNPSRAENDVHRAKRRELKSKTLRAAVKERDGDACRYCGVTVRWADRKTGVGGVLDHVDPRLAAGAANLVVACRSCNSRKQDCTPAAAGMELQPAPQLPADAAGIYAGSTPDQPRIYAGSTDLHLIGPESGADTDTGPNQVQPAETPLSATADRHTDLITSLPETGPITGQTNDRTTVGTGRGGHRGRSRYDPGDAGPAGYRPTVGPPDTPRSPLNPNPYMRTTTTAPLLPS